MISLICSGVAPVLSIAGAIVFSKKSLKGAPRLVEFRVMSKSGTVKPGKGLARSSSSAALRSSISARAAFWRSRNY